MKKNLLFVVLTFALLSGCDYVSLNEKETEQYRLYTLAKESGTTDLSYHDWLESIKGESGKDGVGIVSIEKTSTEGLVDTYTITLSDGSSYNFSINNGADGKDGQDGLQGQTGSQGEKGEQGEQGETGEKGESAYELFVKYNPSYTGSENEWLQDLVEGKLIDYYVTKFEVNFSCKNASVLVYDTQDYSSGETEKHSAYPKDSKTGNDDFSGEGQVNFKVVPDYGYEIESVVADKNYKNLKTQESDGLPENCFRLTKVTGPVNVTIKTKLKVSNELYSVVFKDGDNTVYETSVKCGNCFEKDISTHLINSTPNYGYYFKGWEYDNKIIDVDSFRIYENMEISANYSPKSLGLPSLSINTENNEPIVSKEEYLKCSVSVENANERYEFYNKTGKIKGRGNATWLVDKKPFKLKFDEKIDLFGNGKAKTWTLLANYYDTTLIRNELAYRCASKLESLTYTTSTQQVDLYLNGSYEGVYLICEQVEVNDNRVEIPDDLSEYSPEEIGYLLEMDYRAPNEHDERFYNFNYFFLDYSTYAPFVVSSPDYEDENYSVEYLNYIKEYVLNSYSTIKNGNWDDVKKLVDIDTFAECYIIHEIFKMNDVGFSSVYYYKEPGKDGKLCCGPLWDLDISLGNSVYFGAENPEFLFAKTYNPFYNALLSRTEFCQIVSNKFDENKEQIVNTFNQVILEAKANSKTYERNFERWPNLLGESLIQREPEDLLKCKTWEANVDYVIDWFNRSFDYFESVYNINN